MKAGKIILGASAAIITVGSGLAFKGAHKFLTHRVFGATAKGSTKCLACRSQFTNQGVGGAHATKCHTVANGVKTLFATKTAGALAHTWAWRTAVTVVNKTKCGSNKVTKPTNTP